MKQCPEKDHQFERHCEASFATETSFSFACAMSDGGEGAFVSIQGTPSYLSCFDVRLLREAGDLAGAI